MKEGVMTKDTSREAAVAALNSALIEGDDRAGWTLDAILANPAHRKALLAVLLPVEELADAMPHAFRIGDRRSWAETTLRRLTEGSAALATDGAETP